MTINTLNYQNLALPLSAAPQYWFAAYASGQTIVGNSGNDAIYGVGGDTLIGGTGDDTFYVTGTDQVIVAPGGGVDTIITYWGGYTLPSNVQNLIVQGNGAYGVGNSLDNVIEAVGPGKITLDGGGGNNVLIGGTGETVFVHSVSRQQRCHRPILYLGSTRFGWKTRALHLCCRAVEDAAGGQRRCTPSCEQRFHYVSQRSGQPVFGARFYAAARLFEAAYEL